MKIRGVLCSIIIMIIMSATSAYPLDVIISGDRLSIHADQVPLQTILTQFVNQGIRIRIDPHINPNVSASFDKRDMQKGIDSILKGFGFTLIWESIEGPVGVITRVSEIQIYKPGNRETIQSLGTRSNLAVFMNPVDRSLYVKNELLLRLNQDMNLSDFNKLLRQINGSVIASNVSLGVYRIRLPQNTDIPSLVAQITSYRGVVEAEPNYAYPIGRPYRESASPASFTVLPDVVRPEGTASIALLDSGLDPRYNLEEFVVASLDALDNTQALSDPLGHGTQMALIAAGVIRPDGVPESMTGNNSIIPIRAFDDNGYTSSFDIMRSIDFALQHGARVMSLSWGSETKSRFLEDAMIYARSEGLIIVASAGNEPTGTPVYPAAYQSVIGVGALTPDGSTWKNSNFGDFVMLYAPGFASFPIGHKGDPGIYAGTSISTAFAANLIAQYLSQNPQATIEEIFRSFKRR